MKFGQVSNPELIDFVLPPDNPATHRILTDNKTDEPLKIYVGCAKWNKTDLKNFYPKGTKDELTYYSTQFNSIELNATFYNSPSRDQVLSWKGKASDGFKFFPKITNSISHFSRLIDVSEPVKSFCDSVTLFEDKLGMVFLQMHDNFGTKDFERVVKFVDEFPPNVPLAVEVRNSDWFNSASAAEKYYQLLESHGTTNVIVDTAGRRDLLHMRLTSPVAFVRYVGANHVSDYKRLDDWISRIAQWKKLGLQELYFFVHQNIELESPLLSAYFIKGINMALGTNLKVPKTLLDT
jgi:uncharacterized protein YecE (DUF72 family)